MLIRYNKQNIYFLELATHTKDKEGNAVPISPELGSIKVNRGHLSLLPGTIEVTDDEWKIIQHHAKDLIDKKIIEPLNVKTQTMPGKPAKDAKTLSEVPIRSARQMIKECWDIITLQKWRSDARPDVRVLVLNQIEKILKKEGKDVSSLSDLDLDDVQDKTSVKEKEDQKES